MRCKKRLLIYILFLGLFACEIRGKELPENAILARVGDHLITVQDFIRRAEYTIRPDYCRGNHYIHKKIILNSLIAEKLLALEEAQNSQLDSIEGFQTFLQGRKEQAMRQWYYYDQAYNKVQLDTDQLKKAYNLAGRTIDLAYYTLPNPRIADKVGQALEDGLFFEEIYEAFSGIDSLPREQVGWFDREDPIIHDLLFNDNLTPNQVLGPVKTGDGSFLLMKVIGWIDRPVITEREANQRWKDVEERLGDSKAKNIYKELVGEIMRGKRVDFNEDIFFTYADHVADYYLKSLEEKENQLKMMIWEDQEIQELAPTTLFPDALKHIPFFRVNEQIWTVEDFEKTLQTHPLVFRKQKISHQKFPEQFKLAIVDLIQDRFVTEECYRLGYETVTAVRLNEEMWADYYYARQRRNDVLRSKGVYGDFGEHYRRLIETVLNPYVDSLQNLYSDKIEINMSEFEKIELTSIDMLVTQRNVPYPVMVPQFPILTTDNRLDYGRGMDD